LGKNERSVVHAMVELAFDLGEGGGDVMSKPPPESADTWVENVPNGYMTLDCLVNRNVVINCEGESGLVR
jgi:hypothetical protein